MPVAESVSSDTSTKTSFAAQYAPGGGRDSKPKDASRMLAEKHLYSALHAVNLRILQLQSATFKAQKTGKHNLILSQLHDLTAYQGMLGTLASSLENGSPEVCYQSYLSTIAQVTNRIHHSLHDHHHEDHHDADHEANALQLHHAQTMQLLEAREQEVNLLLDAGYALQVYTHDVRRGTADFNRVVQTAAALEAKPVDERKARALRENAKETLRAEVTEEVITKAADNQLSPDVKLDEVIHQQAKQRWQEIKARAEKIHGVAAEHWNNRDQKIAAVRTAIQGVYNEMVEPHITSWRKAAEAHGTAFADGLGQINQLAGSLNAALESYPSEQVASLEALHKQMSNIAPHCDSCLGVLGQTLDALRERKAAIHRAKEALGKSGSLSIDTLNTALGRIGDYHAEHLPEADMDTALGWLKSSLANLSAAFSELNKALGKDTGPDGKSPIP